MEILLIKHGTEEFRKMVELRMKILRIPLGLSFTEEELEKEKDDFLICSYENGIMTGCCVLTEKSKSVLQLRQMAVDDSYQGKGIGKAILDFAEKITVENNYSTLMMHARDTAINFYKKSGYQIVGDGFIEVTILHHHMEKVLKF